MIYTIAGIKVDMEPKYPRLQKQGKAYITEDTDNVNIRMRVSDEFLQEKHKEYPHLDLEACEYMWLGSEFYNALIEFDGFLLHSSAVVYNGRAYLFSAPCGTGKSTHTQLWLKRFDGAYILNDDKPAIRWNGSGFIVSGTPFSGKSDLNVNASVPLGGICALERGEKNSIEVIGAEEALFRIMNQTVRPNDERRMEKLLSLLDRLISVQPIYKLHCNMDIEAAEVAYNAMKGDNEV